MDDNKKSHALLSVRKDSIVNRDVFDSMKSTSNNKKVLGRSFSEKTINQAQRKDSVSVGSLMQRHTDFNVKLKSQMDDENVKLTHRQKKIDLIEKEKKIRKEIIEENNGWNAELETIVSNIGEKCVGLKWMHSKCVNYYNFWYHFIGVVVIILAAASGTGIVTQVNTCSVDPVTGQKATNWVIILVTILMFLTSVTSAIQQFKNWGQVANQHQNSKASYASLEHDIRIALGVYRKDRQIGKDFVEWISKEFDAIEASSPPIPESIQTKYHKLIGGKDIAHNDTIEKIVIKTHESNSPDESPDADLNISDNAPPAIYLDAIPTERKDSSHNTNEDTLNANESDCGNANVQPQRKKSFVEIDVCEFESPFDNDRYKYEIQRFLDNK